MAVDYSRFAQNSGLDLEGIMNAANMGLRMKQYREEKGKKEALETQQKQIRIDMKEFQNSPQGIEDYKKIMGKHPQLSKHFKENLTSLSALEQKVGRKQSLQLHKALSMGNTNVAIGLLNTRMEAATNSGDEGEAQVLASMIDKIEQDPNSVKALVGISLAADMAPSEFGKSVLGLDDSGKARGLTYEEYQALTPAEKTEYGDFKRGAKERYRPLTAEEKASRPGLDPNKEYQISEDGKKVSEIGGGGTSINISSGGKFGPIPKDYVMKGDDEGGYRMEVIPGSATEAKIIANKKKREGQVEEKTKYANVVFEDIGRFKELVKEAPWYDPVTGVLSAVGEKIRGSNAANADALKTSIVANIGFDRLFEMRQNSPTGGALGNISDKEVKFLQGIMGSLASSQGKEQLLENLNRLEVAYGDFLKKHGADLEKEGLVQGGKITVEDVIPEELKKRSYMNY